MFQPKLSVLASVLVSSMLLMACNDSSTTIVEKDPIVDDGDHDHDHGTASAGRLVIADKDSTVVSVYELEDYSLLQQFTLTNTVSALYASPANRYALAVQRTDDQVEFIDGGQYLEAHGDHFHTINDAPSVASFAFNGSRPTHVTVTDTQLAIFFDGVSGTPASAAVITEHDISANSSNYPQQVFTANMHGAAQARGEFMIATVYDTTAAAVQQVALYHAHGDHFHEEEVFATVCPGLHGSSQNEHFISFGCNDGVLLIEQDGTTFTDSKIAYTSRISTLKGHEDADHFIGYNSTSNSLFAIHPEDAEIEVVDWQPGTATKVVGSSFADHGEKFVIVDDLGYLTILNYHGHSHASAATEPFEVAAKLQLTTADVTAMPAGSNFELAVSAASDEVYILNPLDRSVLTVDLTAGEVVNKLELDFLPFKLVWLGIAGEEEHDHDHDH
ncbi:5-methyltetrahydrofolate--homocysteine methyltransferase [Chromatiaceae bacterium AAb-1]|nr:5-methyltetrahydrofolate--homocysteine methyltransferase [Chromatiaceae bacterium AAb-1]